MIPTLPAAVPRRGGPFTRALGRATLRALGWTVVGEFPDAPKLVVIAAPHRSNWDFIVGLATKFALGLDAAFLAKHTLFRWPFGAVFRFWGGIPVERGAASHTVAAVVAEFESRQKLVVALAPEGTRKPGTAWKTGFWHIAYAAGVPILPAVLDREHRVVRFLPAITPRDMDQDIRALRAKYEALVPGSVAPR